MTGLYGSGTYGSGTYGDPTYVVDERLARYTVYVDWGTGTDADTSEFNDVTAVVLGNPGVGLETGRDQPRAYAPAVVPAAGFELLNEDRTYSPGSTLGQYVGRGPDCTITAGWGADTTLVNDTSALVDQPDVPANGAETISLFSGHLDDVTHDLNYGHRVASVTALGQLTLLKNAAAVTTQLYLDIATGQAITYILDAVGWPSDARQISSGTVVMPFWWLSNADAFEAVQQLVRTEGVGACLYEDGDGVIHFEDVDYRTAAPRSLTSQYTLWDSNANANVGVDDPATLVDESTVYLSGGEIGQLFYTGLEITANPDEVVTEATATVRARSAGSLAQIWQSGTPFTLAPDETRDYYITASTPFQTALTPVAGGTDYTVTAGSLSSITLSQTSGQSARLRLVASASGASIEGPTGDEDQGIQVRAQPIEEHYETVVRSTVDTDASIDRYTGGTAKTYDLGIWDATSIDDAQDLVNAWALRYQAPRTQLQASLVNMDAAHLHALLSLRVSDRVTLVSQQAVETLDCYVETLHHQITTGGLHALTIGCEQISSTPGVIDPTPGGGGGLPAQFGDVSPYAQFGTTHSFTS